MKWLAWMLDPEVKKQKGYTKCRKATDKRVGNMHIVGALACLSVEVLQASGYDKITMPMISDTAKHHVDHPIMKRLVEDGYLDRGTIAGNKLVFALTVIGAEQTSIVRAELSMMIAKFRVPEAALKMEVVG